MAVESEIARQPRTLVAIGVASGKALGLPSGTATRSFRQPYATIISLEAWPLRQNDAATHQNQTTQASTPPPSDPNFYGKGLAYAIFVPDDTLRTKLECGR